MSATLIDGHAIASQIRRRVETDAAALRAAGRPPGLAAVLIGDDSAAMSYARSQRSEASAAGIDYRLITLPAASTSTQAAAVIAELNRDPRVHGIMLHLPVPGSLDAFALQQAIAPEKDVEGVGPANLGLLAMGREALIPCTARAAMACLEATGVGLAGAEAVVVGRSVIVGKPLALLLLAAHCTVTICHTRTRDLARHTRGADVLVAAAGVPRLIGPAHVRPGAVVIDVGTNRVPSPDDPTRTRTVGDVRFEEVASVAGAITPVPGGVGPVTVATLLANTIAAASRQSPQAAL